MKRFAALFFVSALVGCSADPATSRLSVGQEAIVVSDGPEHVVAFADDFAFLKPGDRLVILEDKDIDDESRVRHVKVRVESGEHDGATCKLMRLNIRLRPR